MTLEELHKIISKPQSECDGAELHLRAMWAANNLKSIFYITGLDVSHLLKRDLKPYGVIIKNPYQHETNN